MPSHNDTNDLTGNKPYNYQEPQELKEDRLDKDQTWYVTVKGGDRDVLDTLISERNTEYSAEERANLLDRPNETFTVAYEDRQSAKRAADLFETAGSSVELQTKKNLF